MWNQEKAMRMALVGAGLKQFELALIMKVHPQVVYQYTSGRRKLKLHSTAGDVAKALKISLSDFVAYGE